MQKKTLKDNDVKKKLRWCQRTSLHYPNMFPFIHERLKQRVFKIDWCHSIASQLFQLHGFKNGLISVYQATSSSCQKTTAHDKFFTECYGNFLDTDQSDIDGQDGINKKMKKPR